MSAGPQHDGAPALERLMTAAEVAEVLNISPRKLWELTNCGEIPAVRLGRSVRYDPKDVRKEIERRKKR